MDKERYRNDEYRGIFIDQMIVLESVATVLIASHFCSPDYYRRAEFMHMLGLNPAYSLSTKIDNLLYILKKYYPEVLESDKKIPSDLTRFISIRNHMAHRLQSVDKHHGIALQHYKTKKGGLHEDFVVYKHEDFKADVLRIVSICKKLGKICDQQDKIFVETNNE